LQRGITASTGDLCFRFIEHRKNGQKQRKIACPLSKMHRFKARVINFLTAGKFDGVDGL
jgi:hypothetical protein